MENENNKKKGDNPKGQGPSKPKKEKTKEEKEAARAKQAEKKRLKKEQAKKEEEEKKKKEEGKSVTKEEEKSITKEEKSKKKEKEENIKNPKKVIEGGKKEEKKDIKKNVVKFYGITTFEERNSVSPKETKNPILSTYEIIKYLSTGVRYSKVNEELINSIRNIFVCGSTKQSKNCLNLLNSIKIFIDTVKGDNYNICDEISSIINKVNKLIENISLKCSGLFNTCIYLSKIAHKISEYPNYPNDSIKSKVKEIIQYFIDQRIKDIDNVGVVGNLIQDGDTILLFGRSKIFRKLLWKAKEDKIKFSVIFVDSAKSQISNEIKFFTKLDIPVKYTYIKGVSNLMREVTKVFIKGDSILSNGDLMGKPGSSILALIAKEFNKPSYIFCSSFKFMNRIIIANDPKTIKNEETGYDEMVFEYNITKGDLITAIICENGYIHVSSIPMYIQELEKNYDNAVDSLKNEK